MLPQLLVRGRSPAQLDRPDSSPRQPWRSGALAALLGLSAGCGGEPDPLSLEELLEAHALAEPRGAEALRLEHELEGRGRRWRVVTSIRRQPFGYREESRLLDAPGRPSVGISDGRLAWRPSERGPGVPLEGGQAQRFLARTFMDGRLYLEPGMHRDRSRLLGAAMLPDIEGLPPGFPSGREVLVVTQPVPAGITLGLLFDAADHHLLGTVESQLSFEDWVRYGDWKWFGSVRLPGMRIHGSGDSDRRLVARLVDVEVDPNLDDSLFAGHPIRAAPRAEDGGEFAIIADSVPGHAWLTILDARIQDRPIGSAVVDTGSNSSVVNPALADELDLPFGGAWTAETFVDRAGGYKRWIDRVQHGDRLAYQVTVLSESFRLTSALTTERSPRFLLGGEELLVDGPVIDFVRRRLRFRDRPVPPLSADESARGEVIGLQAVQPDPTSLCFYVRIRLRGHELLALLDTGFGGPLFLTTTAADRVGIPRGFGNQTDPRAFGRQSFGAGGATRMDIVTPISGLEVGPLRYPEVWATIEGPEGATDRERDFDALLGTGALLSFRRVGIDTDRSVIEVELPTDLGRGMDGTVSVPSPGEFSGAIFGTTADGGEVVLDVFEGSPAYRARLRVGDRLASIGGHSVERGALAFVLRELWLQPDQPVAIEVVGPSGESRRLVLRTP